MIRFEQLDDSANAIATNLAEGTASRVQAAAEQVRYLAAQVDRLREITREAVGDDWTDWAAAARYAVAIEDSIARPEARAVQSDPSWPRLVRAAAGRPYALIAARAVLRSVMPDMTISERPAERLARQIEETDARRHAYRDDHHEAGPGRPYRPGPANTLGGTMTRIDATPHLTQLEAAVTALREAAADHADADLGVSIDADALELATRLTTAVRDRLSAEPVLDGATRLVPVASLMPGDRLVGGFGCVTETVTEVTRRLYTVTVHTDTGDTHDLDHTSVEITT